MVGGKIYSIFKDGKQAHVVVRGTGSEKNDFTEVTVEHDGHALGVGDSLWWHGRVAYWTPQNGMEEDIPLQRIGYSGNVPRELEGD